MCKRLISIFIILTVLCSILPTFGGASDSPDFSGTCGEGLTWKLDPFKGILTISGDGTMDDYSYADNAPWYPCRSRIFQVVIEAKLSNIGSYAFYECNQMTACNASGCTLASIGDGAFSSCAALTSFTFTPGQRIAVGEDAFFSCSSLKKLDLSAINGTIGLSAFAGCTKLESIELPRRMTALPASTFSGCSSLTGVTLPKNLETIGKSCFAGCTALKEMTFPEALVTVDRFAFSGCNALELTFTGNAPNFAPQGDVSASFPTGSVLSYHFGTEGWEWPSFKGYASSRIYDSLDEVFTDLKKDGWYIPGIQHVYFTGLMNGLREKEFGPDRPMSRAQLVTVLYRASGSPAVTTVNPFTDVEKNAYYYDAVRWAKGNGIVTGITATTFQPDTSLSRQQICAILYRYAAYCDLPLTERTSLTDFVDTDQIDSYAVDPVNWCVATGLVGGKPGKRLDPKGTATRAEIAKILTAFTTALEASKIAARDEWLKSFTDPEDTEPTDPYLSYAKEIFDTINKKRTDAGLSPLIWNDTVYKAAKTRAQELSGENNFGHTRPDGTEYSTVFNQYHIESTSKNEIVAHGYTSAQALVDVWSTAASTSPVLQAPLYSAGAVGVYQAAPKDGEAVGRYYYALLVIG